MTGAILRLQEVPAALPANVKFDEFDLDCNRYQLFRAGRRVKLEKLPMELLILLLEKEGHLVMREEVINRLWGKGSFSTPSTVSIRPSARSAMSFAMTQSGRVSYRPSPAGGTGSLPQLT